jgi:phospholipid transport system substrate-binding protein
MSFRVYTTWIAACCLLVSGAWAQQTESVPTAYEVVQGATVQVMEVVVEARSYVDAEPERYYQAVQDILDPVIDFRGFARSVMGPYASSERYRTLDEAGRVQLREQLDRFTEVMRQGLVRTYSKGLLAFGGSRIEVVQPPAAVKETSRVSVHQLIYSEEAEPYVLMYQMGRSKSGVWKLRNVIIESVNLGEIYRNQFQASARKHDGNLDTVIDSWSSAEVDTSAPTPS